MLTGQLGKPRFQGFSLGTVGPVFIPNLNILLDRGANFFAQVGIFLGMGHQRGVVVSELPFHPGELGLGLVQLHLPVLGTAVVLPKRRSRVVQRDFQGGYFLFLGVDLLIEDGVPGGKGLGGAVVFVELGGDQLHLRAQDFKGLVDFGQALFEDFLSFETDAESEIIYEWSPHFRIEKSVFFEYNKR
ncbi:MAG: hypothetical protein FWE89_06810, partial [Syntrophaceae bacterium]|nr:hypothetical protein [Syntrophaceae bacterium]